MWMVLAIAMLAVAQDAGATKAEPMPAAVATEKAGEPNASTAPIAESAKKDAAKQDEPTKAEAEPEESTLSKMANSGALGYMIRGGFFMWPILILGILAIGVIIERFRSLKMLTTNTEALREQVRVLLEADRAEEALKLCDREQGPVPAILSAGLRKYVVLQRLNYDAAKVEEQVVKGMDDYTVHIVAALERHLPILATVSSVAPMIGFLGTVQGMVISFDDIVRTLGEKNIVQAAAEGIMVSLLTTVLGLIVGIPAFMAYNYFTSVINGFVLDVEESASELMETVTLNLALKQESP